LATPKVLPLTLYLPLSGCNSENIIVEYIRYIIYAYIAIIDCDRELREWLKTTGATMFDEAIVT
jgi:hypothetical protein